MFLESLPKKHCTHPWASPRQGSVAQQQTGQLGRSVIKKLKSNGMFLDKPQVFLNVIFRN